MSMKLGPKGLALIKSFESFVPYVYDDLVAPVKGKYKEWDGGHVKGTLTIGYGHTNAAKYPLKCTKGLRVTEPEACNILSVDLDDAADAVRRFVRKPLTQGQFDALVSFTYNCGAGNLKKLIVPLNQGDYDGTRARFDSYVKSKGITLRGLQRRRDAEQMLWDDRYEDIEQPTAPVYHTAEVDAPAAPQPSSDDKLIEKAAVAAPILTAASSFADWKVAAVVGTVLLIGLVALFLYKRSRM